MGNLLDKIKEMTGQSPKTVIALGCGTGDALVKFAEHKLKVLGIDSSEIAMEKAIVKLGDLKILDASVQLVDLEKLGDRGVFDIVFCKLVYAFIEDKERFLKSIKSMMSTHSVFVLMTPVLYKGIVYGPKDKPGIAVDFDEAKDILTKEFGKLEIFAHDYFDDKGDLVTFLAQK
ncbi:MAG: class I SAM-dependent methyltransferase [bacterium]|nr:class I SAM-dependent methyltransferase [bacterium]